ncbi:CidA/LrgA family protein [Ferrimonas marina]|uniref:Holin-like protein n=1 Tax=Ferrimonas marina TaxID=299255 RepID=A0A1M5VYD9_9GAMM|nr:CidA/LrgA family protein [Ferrimonas marina]SHH80208.1 holin-like protein [Ferrimonas marina]
MELLLGFAGLIGLWLLGEGLSELLSLPIPGSVIGMLLLFIGLVIRGREPQAITQASDGLLRYLGLLFVPAGVGLMVYIELIKEAWLPATVAILLATLITLLSSAGAMTLAKRWGKDNHDA